jgi:hypothetical protein
MAQLSAPFFLTLLQIDSLGSDHEENIFSVTDASSGNRRRIAWWV